MKQETEHDTSEREVGNNFNDRMDILKHVSDIKVRLKNDITNDFVLAKLGEKDKIYIIEMTGNAYFSKKLLETIKEKGTKWEWDRDGRAKKVGLDDEQKKKIQRIAKSVFDSYMVKIYMTVILNRNVDRNYLINVLSGYNEPEEIEQQGNNKDEIKNAVSELLADKSNKEK